MTSDRLGIDPAQRPDDVATPQLERMPCDRDATNNSLLWHGFSVTVSLWCLRRIALCEPQLTGQGACRGVRVAERSPCATPAMRASQNGRTLGCADSGVLGNCGGSVEQSVGSLHVALQRWQRWRAEDRRG